MFSVMEPLPEIPECIFDKTKKIIYYWQQDQIFTTMKPWHVPNLAEGSAAPQVDHDKVTVYNMRYQV